MTWISDLHEGKQRRLREVYDGPRGNGVRAHIGADEYDFGIWMMLVDMAVTRGAGVSAYDLADQSWHDRFRAGQAPGDAANEVIGIEMDEMGFSE